jgi:arabinofuranosyltransferase
VSVLPGDPGSLTIPLLIALFAVQLLRTAWLSDDASITFRTIDNFLDGFGLRWNAGERVQAYTHPLWMFVVSAVTLVVGEPYYASLIVSIACSVLVVVLYAKRIVSGWQPATMGLAFMLLSQAFVDYSTSGLENPLTHLLLVVFVIVHLKAHRSPRELGIQTLLAALLMTNRLDAGILVLPALAVRIARNWSTPTLIAALLGLLPLAAWEMFSLLYYGFLVPNTAFAKLSTGIPSAELMQQGLVYLGDSLARDPLTLTAIAGGLLTACVAPRTAWPLALGIVLHLLYVVRIGGDFMSGRFLTAPFLMALCIVGRCMPAAVTRRWPVALAGIVVIGCLSPPRPFMSDSAYGSGDWRRIPASGIVDERRYYYQVSGLLRMTRYAPTPTTDEPARARKYLDDGRRVVPRDAVGYFGVAAGRRLHVVDVLGLGDPLMARLPTQRPWRIGHFYRAIPEGYIETLESGTNQIRDPQLASYYDTLRLITTGPIWSWTRMRAIVEMNLGRHDHLLPSPQ